MENQQQATKEELRQAAMQCDARHRALCNKRGDYRAEIKLAAKASQAAWLAYFRAKRS
jgi:arsenate reductase-like glutaredoxin family protein